MSKVSIFCFLFYDFRPVAVNESLTATEWHFLVTFINQSATLKCFFFRFVGHWADVAMAAVSGAIFHFYPFCRIVMKVAISFRHLICAIYMYSTYFVHMVDLLALHLTCLPACNLQYIIHFITFCVCRSLLILYRCFDFIWIIEPSASQQ